MKSLVFDSGPIISLTTNNLLSLLEDLKKHYKGIFYITKGVRNELIDRPLETKRFKFEALQVMKSIQDNIIELYEDDELNNKTLQILDIANNIFQARGNYLRVLHYAEVSALAAAILLGSDALVVDERTTRLLIENPARLAKIFRKRLHTQVFVNQENLREFHRQAKGVKIIRSIELVTIAYELGLLKKYFLDIPNPKATLLDGVLWAVKMQGCSVAEEEIEDILKMEENK